VPYVRSQTLQVNDRIFLQDLLGLHKHGEFRSEKENVDEDILVMGRGLATVEVDIMAPLDIAKSPKVQTIGSRCAFALTSGVAGWRTCRSPSNLNHRTCCHQVHTPNLNHIGLWIDDLDSCVTWLQGHGVRFAGKGVGRRNLMKRS
jgi:lactoylglutathione lyase